MVLFFTRLPAPGLLLPTLTDRGRGMTAPPTYFWKWYFISQTPDPRKSKLLRFRFYFLATSGCLNECIREAMGPILPFQLALRVKLASWFPIQIEICTPLGWPSVLQANVQRTAPRPARPYMQQHVQEHTIYTHIVKACIWSTTGKQACIVSVHIQLEVREEALWMLHRRADKHTDCHTDRYRDRWHLWYRRTD